MPIREFPDPTEILLDSIIVEGVTLEGGTAASSALSTFQELFLDGSIFDGGLA